jgi:hypothetical protein
MAVDLAHDLWQELKRYISVPDRTDAADALVNLLVDNDYDAEEIKSAFKNDTDIKRALSEYLIDESDSEEEEEEFEDDEY